MSPQDGELVTQNNVRESLVNVRDVREQILYFEGEPRFEMKFLRRAVADDKNLEVVALQRTADNKYMRLFGDEPEDPEELVGGFPKTREELFKYRGLILGSVEAGVFAGDQLQMIAEFVERRGGGLLMLGGARSFGEGGYGGTPVADALPLLIDPRTRASDPSGLARLKIAPTRAGQAHAVTQIAPSEAASIARWNELPQVTAVNAPLAVKPGATVLLNGTDERGRTQPVLSCAAIRAWERHRVDCPGHLAVADARVDPPRGSDPRTPVASAHALAGGRRARRRRCARHERSHRAGRRRHHRSRGGGQAVRGIERCHRGRDDCASWRHDDDRAASVDR